MSFRRDDPKNLEAHKLLGRIYLRSLGDMPGGNGSDNILKLAIDQYEQIVKLDPQSVDNHLLLGRLYRLNNDLQKAEGELNAAIKIDPSVVDPDDIETLEDLVVAAVIEATRQAKELQSQKLGAVTGGLDLDSLLGGLGGPGTP